MARIHSELLRALPVALKQHAARRGGNTAYEDARRSVTYRELERRTAGLAGRLRRLGVRRGDRVALCLGNRVELVESCLAVVRAGAVGVLLDPAAPEAELADRLRDCGPVLAVAEAASPLAAGRVGRALRTVVVGDAPAELAFEDLATGDPGIPPRDDLGLDEPAWIHYTSGTTDRARGVVSSQRAALWSVVAGYVPLWGLGPCDRLLWPLPMTHAYAHSLCLMGVVSVGASAYLLDRGTSPAHAPAGRPFTLLAGVPATYRLLLDESRGTSRPPLPGLRLCVTGGAPCPEGLRAEVEERLGAPLLDGYGSTETCGKIAITPLVITPLAASPRPVPLDAPTAPVPLPGVEVRLTDPTTGEDVTDGGEGEIRVRGPHLMSGYHGRPDKSARALVDGWYRTGDLGRRTRGGGLLVTGRVKELIISGGENINPSEVEDVLLRCPGVADAAVVGGPHDVLGQVPVAFVVPGPAGVDHEAVRRACREQLSSFKVPAEIHESVALPRTTSGKIERRLLARRLAERAPEARAAATAALLARLRPLPAPGRHEALLRLVLDALAGAGGTPDDVAHGDVVPDLPFTALALDSLGGVRLRDRLSAATGLTLPATLVFEHPTPVAVARSLYAALLGEPGPGPAAGPVLGPGPEAGSASGDDTSGTEPVAIVAMACRYPGAARDVTSPEELWRLVAEGTDATSGFPSDRGWDLAGIFDPTRTGSARPSPAEGDSCAGRRTSTRRSSACRPGRRWPPIRSSGCCWRSRGSCWSGRASARPPCAAVTPACSSA